MLAALVAAFAFGTAIAARAEIDHYRDALMPNGRARNMAAKRADMRACGAVNGIVLDNDFPRANACVKATAGCLIASCTIGPREAALPMILSTPCGKPVHSSPTAKLGQLRLLSRWEAASVGGLFHFERASSRNRIAKVGPRFS
jgi:hypothetical protein